jgi:hypothetical protein
MTRDRTLKVWLGKELAHSENGHFQLEGSYGNEAVVVMLDPSITSQFPKGGESEAVLGLHRKIEDAATRAFGIEGRVNRVHKYCSPVFRHNLIAVPDADLAALEP